MPFKSILRRSVPLPDDFSMYHLYNDNRAGVYKVQLYQLISNAFLKKYITVQKFIVAENINDKIFNTKSLTNKERPLFHRLKDYHNEADEFARSLIYFLKSLDPNVQIDIVLDNNNVTVSSQLFEIKINELIHSTSAKAKLFLPNEKIAVITTNTDITNLFDLIALQDITVYIIEPDHWKNKMLVYKINRNESFLKIADQFNKDLQEQLKAIYEKYKR